MRLERDVESPSGSEDRARLGEQLSWLTPGDVARTANCGSLRTRTPACGPGAVGYRAGPETAKSQSRGSSSPSRSPQPHPTERLSRRPRRQVHTANHYPGPHRRTGLVHASNDHDCSNEEEKDRSPLDRCAGTESSRHRRRQERHQILLNVFSGAHFVEICPRAPFQKRGVLGVFRRLGG